MMVRMNFRSTVVELVLSLMTGSRLSNRLEELQIKRMDLEAHRTSIVSQIHQLQTQIASRRKEGNEKRICVFESE